MTHNSLIPSGPAREPSRRSFLAAVGGGFAALALAGCTNSELDQPSTATSTTSGSPSANAFPVSVTHRFGTTTVKSEPTRIVALGQTDCDPLIALGITPIAIGSFVDDWYNAVNPWNEKGFPDGKPEEVSFVEIPFEKIAALRPDLITMASGGITKSDYTTLTKIAPVIGPPVGYQDSAVPYAPHTQIIGQAVGRVEAAEQLVADVDAQYAAVRAAHPEWASITAQHAECWSGDFYILGSNAPRTNFLTSIGFTLSPDLQAITGDEYSKQISAEELDMVGDVGMVCWCTDEGAIPTLQKNPVVSRLDNVKQGEAIWISAAKTDLFMWSMDWGTVLSTPYAIEKGLPLIEAALAGQSPVAPGNNA